MKQGSSIPATVLKQFIKFGIVGAFNSFINYIIYILCIKMGLHYITSNTVGFVVAVFSAYLLQNKFVFTENREERIWWRALLKTYISYAFTGLILTNLLSILWIDILDLQELFRPIFEGLDSYFSWWNMENSIEYIAPIFNMVVIVPINFAINKTWTYRNSKK